MDKDTLNAQLQSILPILYSAERHRRKLNGISREIGNLKQSQTDAYRDGERVSLSVFFYSFMAYLAFIYIVFFGGKLIGVLSVHIVALIGAVMFARLIGIPAKAVKRARAARKCEAIQQQIDLKDADWDRADQEMRSEISPQWPRVLAVVPEKYANSFCVKHLCDYLTAGRADNLKEALNLFEEEQHRTRMEENQREMTEQIEQQQKEIKNLKEMQSYLETRVSDAEYAANNRY